jgi:hypothetical protein
MNRLSPLEVANAKVGMHADGGGLYLQVTKTVAGQLNKSWLFRYSVGGRERQMGLGSLTEIKLAAARERATECRLQRLAGTDPIEERERARRLADASGITFRQAFENFFPVNARACRMRSMPRSGNRQWKATSSRQLAIGRSERSKRGRSSTC